MKILDPKTSGKQHLLGTFQMTNKTALVTDPCYKPGTWCQKKISNILQGTWKGYLYRKIDQLSVKWHNEEVEKLKANIEKYKSLGPEFTEHFQELLERSEKFDCSRVSVLMAHHESVNPFSTDFSDKWKDIKVSVGVDSGQMSISSVDNWTKEENCLYYEGPETPNEEFPSIPNRGTTGPYWKVCDITCNETGLGGGVFDNRAVVSQTGYGDGSYPVFTLTHNKKVVGIAVVFMFEDDDDEEDN